MVIWIGKILVKKYNLTNLIKN